MAGYPVCRQFISSMNRCSILKTSAPHLRALSHFPTASQPTNQPTTTLSRIENQQKLSYAELLQNTKRLAIGGNSYLLQGGSSSAKSSLLRSQQLTTSPVSASSVRHFSTSAVCLKKIRNKTWYAKWRRKYFDWKTYKGEALGLLPEREFDTALNYKGFNKSARRVAIIKLFEELLEKERVVCSYGRARGLARFTQLAIDCAKEGKEPLIYSWLNKKELVPVVFDKLLARYDGPIGGTYTQVYRLREPNLPQKQMKGQMGVVELIGNPLPRIVPPQVALEQSTISRWHNSLEYKPPKEGTLV